MLSNISYMNSWIFMGDDRHGGVRDLSETTFRLSQSCCRPEGDQKWSNPMKISWDIFRSAFRLFNNRKLSCKTPISQTLRYCETLFCTTVSTWKHLRGNCDNTRTCSKCWSTKGPPESLSSRIIPLVSTTPTRYWGLLVISDPKKLHLWCERNASS